MPTYQATLFLGDNDGTFGYSEPYYLTAATPAAAKTAMDALIGERIKVLVDIHSVFAGRVSDVAILNDSLLSAVTPLEGLIASTIATAVQPWTALNARCEAGAAARGRHFWHGILENTFQDNRHYDPANPNAAAWTAWVVFVAANTLLRHMVAAVPTYSAITDVIPIRETSKKVGRPFELLRGRRPT